MDEVQLSNPFLTTDLVIMFTHLPPSVITL